MSKIFKSTLLLFFVAALLMSTASAKSHKFAVWDTTLVNGVELERGDYSVKLNGADEAEIYRNGKLVVTTLVEVVPLDDRSQRNSTLRIAGVLKEIRLKETKLVLSTPNSD